MSDGVERVERASPPREPLMPESTRFGADPAGGGDDRVRELEAAVQARDELMAMTGHELRNPMNTLSLEVELLLRHASAGRPAAALVPRLETLARHMVRFTKRAATLLDVSQLAAGPDHLGPQGPRQRPRPRAARVQDPDRRRAALPGAPAAPPPARARSTSRSRAQRWVRKVQRPVAAQAS